MLAAPPTRTSWRRSSGRTRRVIVRKHSKSASRSGAAMVTLGFGMLQRSETRRVAANFNSTCCQ
jgi:hypothetical protein